MPFAVVAAGIGLVSASEGADAQDNATAAQANTAAGQQQIAQEQLDFNKKVYDDGAAARAKQTQLAGDIGDQQLQGMQFATAQAKDDQDYTNTTFRPLEKSLVSDAEAYDTPQRRADAAAAAQADVNQSFDSNRTASERDLARSGIAPGSGKSLSLMQDASVAQAAAGAGAGTMAARNVEQQGYAREMDAAALGRNLPSSQATQQQIAATTGTAGTVAGAAGVAAQSSGVANMNAGFAGASAANNSAGNLYGGASKGFGDINTAISSGFGSLSKAVGSVPSSSWSNIGSWMQGLTQPGVTVDTSGYGIGTDGQIPGWKEGGPVLVSNLPAAAAPATAAPRAMPRMGGTPAAPANRGSYQALPLSKKKAFAGGGMVNATVGGPAVGAPPGRDTILAKLDNGEHVVDARAVIAIGGGSNARGQDRLNFMRKVVKERARMAA